MNDDRAIPVLLNARRSAAEVSALTVSCLKTCVVTGFGLSGPC